MENSCLGDFINACLQFTAPIKWSNKVVKCNVTLLCPKSEGWGWSSGMQCLLQAQPTDTGDIASWVCYPVLFFSLTGVCKVTAQQYVLVHVCLSAILPNTLCLFLHREPITNHLPCSWSGHQLAAMVIRMTSVLFSLISQSDTKGGKIWFLFISHLAASHIQEHQALSPDVASSRDSHPD